METFEQRIQREKDEAKTKRARLAKIIKSIGFEPEESEDEGSRAYVRGKRGDGARCGIEQDTYKMNGRIGFTAWTPEPEDGTCIKTPDQITMASTKTDAQIIADINKRYMPAMDPAMDEYRKRYNRARNAEMAQDALISGCAQLLGYKMATRTRTGEKPKLYEYPENDHVSKITIETDYYGKEARMELCLSLEASMLICSKLGEWIKKGNLNA